MKKIVLLFCAFLPLAGYALTYLDYAYILADQGIIVSRDNDADYRVNDPVWRQEVIGMAVKMNESIDLDTYSCKGTFVDITTTTPNSWICRAAEAAADKGIITKGANYPTDRIGVNPERNITRAEALAIVWDALSVPRATDEIVAQYTYSSDTVGWQKRLLAAAYERGIIVSTSTFGPNVDASRGEIFEIVAKLKGLAPTEGNILDPELEALFEELMQILQDA